MTEAHDLSRFAVSSAQSATNSQTQHQTGWRLRRGAMSLAKIMLDQLVVARRIVEDGHKSKRPAPEQLGGPLCKA